MVLIECECVRMSLLFSCFTAVMFYIHKFTKKSAIRTKKLFLFDFDMHQGAPLTSTRAISETDVCRPEFRIEISYKSHIGYAVCVAFAQMHFSMRIYGRKINVFR